MKIRTMLDLVHYLEVAQAVYVYSSALDEFIKVDQRALLTKLTFADPEQTHATGGDLAEVTTNENDGYEVWIS